MPRLVTFQNGALLGGLIFAAAVAFATCAPRVHAWETKAPQPIAADVYHESTERHATTSGGSISIGGTGCPTGDRFEAPNAALSTIKLTPFCMAHMRYVALVTSCSLNKFLPQWDEHGTVLFKGDGSSTVMLHKLNHDCTLMQKAGVEVEKQYQLALPNPVWAWFGKWLMPDILRGLFDGNV